VIPCHRWLTKPRTLAAAATYTGRSWPPRPLHAVAMPVPPEHALLGTSPLPRDGPCLRRLAEAMDGCCLAHREHRMNTVPQPCRGCCRTPSAPCGTPGVHPSLLPLPSTLHRVSHSCRLHTCTGLRASAPSCGAAPVATCGHRMAQGRHARAQDHWSLRGFDATAELDCSALRL
jgi:hypothetical protein